MPDGMLSRDGWCLLRSGLRGSRHPMLRITAWSVVEATPSLASGLAVAAALDQGFLAGHPLVGLGWLSLAGMLFVVRAIAERATFPHLARVVEPLRDHLVRHVVTDTLHSAAGSGRAPDAATVSRLTRQVEVVRLLTAALLRTARPLTGTLLATVVGLTALSPAAAALALPPLAFALAAFPYGLRRMARRRHALILAEELVAARTGAVLTAGRDINALGADDRAVAEIAEAAARYVKANQGVAFAGSAQMLTVVVGGYLPVLAILLAAPVLTAQGLLTTGSLVGAVTYVTGQLLPTVRALAGTLGVYWTQLAITLTRLAETAGTTSSATATPPTSPQGHDVAIDGLTFSYGPEAEPVLSNLSLTMPPGDHLAIVGASGIGKSTLANLLAGVEQPTSGTVRVGGVPAGELSPPVRGGPVALVPQEAYVFAGSVLDNLRYLNREATEAELLRAADLLGICPLLDRLGGLRAHLTEPAVELSSGERQLLVLARVYVSRARVIVLDEATCHLDPVTEARTELAFAARPGSLIVIAHRITSATRARNVLLLDNGQVDAGSHADLLSRNARYAELVGRWRPPPFVTASHVKASRHRGV
ncbi:ABC transporter ATP-binding protein [Acrocarpospora phusangensis]|uniref:ABC transporter ATP-binding protein n=1 Tax=Acrocarpospora phusangensis TaxID=1070424 RepID=A0A919UKC2_9ACTN|nr:ABC transporter ATP-binding protein [Acrocarpospora phusangensis]GIH24889.1 ABC transporter ATP-binding protein [Acrocarpospora phusangensis]